MNILHIITQLELGGAQRSTLELLARLDRRRFTPTLLSSDGWLSPRARSISGLPVILWSSLRRHIHPLADSYTLARLVAFIRAGAYAIVHTHSSKAGILGRWAARLAQVPVIVHTAHGFGFHPFQRPWVQWSVAEIERWTARISDGLIVVSERDRHTALTLGIATPEQCALIRYGIEPERAAPRRRHQPTLCRALGLDPDRPIIGTVACLKPQKAPLDFVRACHQISRKMPDAQFLLIGDGALRHSVERLRDRLGLTRALRLLGWREDIPELLAMMDLFVLASRWEGLPIACLEAMAAGVPVVATAAGGTPELIEHGRTGWLVPVAQPGQLADAVVQLLRTPQRLHQLGVEAGQSVRGQYTMDRMVRQTEQFYDQLLRTAPVGDRSSMAPARKTAPWLEDREGQRAEPCGRSAEGVAVGAFEDR